MRRPCTSKNRQAIPAETGSLEFLMLECVSDVSQAFCTQQTWGSKCFQFTPSNTNLIIPEISRKRFRKNNPRHKPWHLVHSAYTFAVQNPSRIQNPRWKAKIEKSGRTSDSKHAPPFLFCARNTAVAMVPRPNVGFPGKGDLGFEVHCLGFRPLWGCVS
jgi:hypothetical protein